jgi:hypothetical protein
MEICDKSLRYHHIPPMLVLHYALYLDGFLSIISYASCMAICFLRRSYCILGLVLKTTYSRMIATAVDIERSCYHRRIFRMNTGITHRNHKSKRNLLLWRLSHSWFARNLIFIIYLPLVCGVFLDATIGCMSRSEFTKLALYLLDEIDCW